MNDQHQRKHLLFLRSALTEYNPMMDTKEIRNWLKKRNEETYVNVVRRQLQDLKNWGFDGVTGDINHSTGKFFSIVGVEVNTNWNHVRASWTQPIINQPEVGFLGIITKEIDGILYFLMQAKIEPGNVNHVQLSPTLQATRSNYTRAHQGKAPLYLEYFQDRSKYPVLLDQLQSEQGGRFLRKRNRNIIIQVQENIPVHDDFVWLTLGQLQQLASTDNLVNMDTRTVISGIPFGDFSSRVVDFYHILERLSETKNSYRSGMIKSLLDAESSYHSLDDIIAWIADLKATTELTVQRVPLTGISEWVKEDYVIRHKDNKFFQVIGVEVEIGNREVQSWMQPMIEPAQEGLCAFIIKEIEGIYHFLVQAKLECGNFDILELAPTVQCLTGNFRDTAKGSLPFLDEVLTAKKEQIFFDTLQSEEGGRFYREQNRNVIVEMGEEFSMDLPPNYIWMTLNQLKTFIKFNNYLNIQARSLISAIGII